RILAVDDDPAYLRYLKLVLTRAGFDVELAADGAAAIERIRSGSRVDLLLIDLAMPGLDGIETVRHIQQESHLPGLYTILLTASMGVETKLRALDGGLDDFITKQSQESEILAKIRSAARRLQLERQLHAANELLLALALTDELTGIANRRAIFKAGEQILRNGRQCSVVLFDLDRFKSINDTFGHLTGDRILADVAATFKAHTRYGDLIGRYGGDEFVLLLPDTGAEEARLIAHRVMARIRQLSWTMSDTRVCVSVQCGISTFPESATSLPELLALCDAALYRVKRRTKKAAGRRAARP
ncbi:MAG TPA: diguanylate cyclase, partial [Thermoanaerobaculia bacterium]|nr:diguanylate cyclase [Thermoanaerobaculia bacterium]